GDRDAWPREVTVNGRPAAVLNREGRPALQLPAGSHAVAGSLHLPTRPQALPIPEETALLSLSVDGEPVPCPRREGGNLWLQGGGAAAAAGGNAIEVQVFRRLEDDIPRRLETVVRLSVAGAARELRM